MKKWHKTLYMADIISVSHMALHNGSFFWNIFILPLLMKNHVLSICGGLSMSYKCSCERALQLLYLFTKLKNYFVVEGISRSGKCGWLWSVVVTHWSLLQPWKPGGGGGHQHHYITLIGSVGLIYRNYKQQVTEDWAYQMWISDWYLDEQPLGDWLSLWPAQPSSLRDWQLDLPLSAEQGRWNYLMEFYDILINYCINLMVSKSTFMENRILGFWVCLFFRFYNLKGLKLHNCR